MSQLHIASDPRRGACVQLTAPLLRDRVVGVDFSGAAQAGRKIWLCEGVVQGDALVVRASYPATVLTGGDPRRAAALAGLRALIRDSAEAAFGFDFSFALPASLTEASSWRDFLQRFGERYPTPEAFRAWCRDRDGGSELKRATEVRARVPFAAYNLRIFRQTYFGLRDLLAPLVSEGRAVALPMMALEGEGALLLEVCPASALKRLALTHPYKGRQDGRRVSRASLVAKLLARDDLVLADEGLRTVLVEDAEGDALDSFIAAAIAFWTLRTPSQLLADEPSAKVEGRVFY